MLCSLCYVVYFLQTDCVLSFRFDADDCEVDSEGEDDEVNGNEDGEGAGNEDDSEEGWLRVWACNNCKSKFNWIERCLLTIKKIISMCI